MPRPVSKRALNELETLTTTPPTELPPSHTIARIVKNQGSNLFFVECLDTSSTSKQEPGGLSRLLVELAPIFRGKAWLRRGGFVVVDTDAFKDRENKLGGEIVNVVRDERDWRKMSYWPSEFQKKVESDSEGEENVVGKMPPDEEED